MIGCIDEVVNAAITQTGGIEDILKAAIAQANKKRQATQDIRRENATLKADLDNANSKIAWLEDLIQHEEGSKTRVLQEQRSHYLQIGDPDFRRVVREKEMQQATDIHEIASLETQFLGNRTYKGHGLNNAATSAIRARSSTTVASAMSPPGLPVPDSPSRRARASTLVNSASRPFDPTVGSPVFNAGSTKPTIDLLAVAHAPRVYGLRNAQGRYESLIICAKCHKIFAFNSWNPEHYKNCKGPDDAASPVSGTHSMPYL
ncbi:uncharacterized protein CC84DRAFT_1235999 [Paraphaeosphaeria sporulosa]|uniref:Uncharacterized protein n=1 Tax=Paraphaeosphaeria sporulosa TaxID=1460663 RepID=A0A177CSN6_9PLEO|nr:uncharacterized protein CC84DRAFT_1235999 [Paraphaeosphaeria sporulosa]OAG09988.1 hypothetical protein CC84DRAFT_1235999 [Paraphaeosphaeria sporulosa]